MILMVLNKFALLLDPIIIFYSTLPKRRMGLVDVGREGVVIAHCKYYRYPKPCKIKIALGNFFVGKTIFD